MHRPTGEFFPGTIPFPFDRPRVEPLQRRSWLYRIFVAPFVDRDNRALYRKGRF